VLAGIKQILCLFLFCFSHRLIHAHLVCVALILLDVLRWRLLRYGIKSSLLTMAATVKWVMGQAGNMLVHLIKESPLSTRSLMRRINTG